jgi:elongation factor P
MLIATQLRAGNTIVFKGEPCRITSVSHVTPGKGRGMVQTKLRNLKTGIGFENRFNSDEKVEKAFLTQHEMVYLYNTDTDYFFMNNETYEQISLTKEELGDNTSYLVADVKFMVEFFEDSPVGVQPPKVVELKVMDTPPNMKGATASSSGKPATLETGLVVSVPAFIEIGEVVRVDTTDGKYLERAKS